MGVGKSVGGLDEVGFGDGVVFDGVEDFVGDGGGDVFVLMVGGIIDDDGVVDVVVEVVGYGDGDIFEVVFVDFGLEVLNELEGFFFEVVFLRGVVGVEVVVDEEMVGGFIYGGGG